MDAPRAGSRRLAGVLVATLTAVAGLPGCSGSTPSTPSARPTPSSPPSAGSRAIPQPPVSELNRATRHRLATASERVDLTLPRFSHPTAVTNPLFPIADLDAVIVGEVEGKPLKIETTLLPGTKVVTWRGERIEALQSQFCAFLRGRITEVAVDLYAQADDGSVWYLGEDVVDYAHGRAESTEGTWRVGLDGPPAMIMPGDPRVGDVYRTENIPGVAFEQVTIRRVGVTVEGPTGPVHGAIVGQELHQDERSLEDKLFAPGYGEFFSGGGHDFEANALSVPVDARPGPVPAALRAVRSHAWEALHATRARDWPAARGALRGLSARWAEHRTGPVPPRLEDAMQAAVRTLTGAVHARHGVAAAGAALDVADLALDLELQFRQPAAINRARLALWTHRLAADAAAGDAAAVLGDVTTLAWVRDRLSVNPSAAQGLDDALRHLRAVSEAGELDQARVFAARVRAGLRARA